MKRMVRFGLFAVIGIMLLVMPVSADAACIPDMYSGEGLLRGTNSANFDNFGNDILNVADMNQRDIWWEQTGEGPALQMVPVNGATIAYIGQNGWDDFGDLTFSTTPIPGYQLAQGDMFVVYTSGNNYAFVEVLNPGYDITLQWDTADMSSCPDTHYIAEFPSPFLPVILGTGFLGAVLLIWRTREE